MYQADKSDVDRLVREGCDVWTAELWSNWISVSSVFESCLADIEEAFADVELGDGIGMLEADGIDNYVDSGERELLRNEDRRQRWQNISAEELNANYCSFGYCDAEGGRFLLPACLLADLRDRYDFDFVSHLVNCVFNKENRSGHAWIGCLNEKQVAALCGLFELLKQHPDYYSRKEKLSEVVRVVGQGFRPDHAG